MDDIPKNLVMPVDVLYKIRSKTLIDIMSELAAITSAKV